MAWEAQKQRQVYSHKNKTQIAAETPLGWVIIGPRSTKSPARLEKDRTWRRLWCQKHPGEAKRVSKINSKVLKTETQGESEVQHYIEPRENSLIGTKEDELTVYSQDEVRFLRETVTNI